MRPFEAAWQRIDRAGTHRKAAADAWNAFLEQEPYDFSLTHEREGKFVMRVHQEFPPPPEMAIEIGEWLYNLRCALDYAVYDAAIVVSGQDPPPQAGQLEHPVCFTEAQFRRNEHRLKPLPDHQREIIESMQPYRHPDPDTSALGWLHKLARIDRHRTLHVMTAYAAEINPLIEVPEGCTVDLEFGERVVVDHEAEIARFTVTPWSDDFEPGEVNVNPRTGLDPEIAEISGSPFWSRISYNERLFMIDMVVKTIVIPLEYDCLGTSRHADFLMDDFRAECDARREERERTGHW